MSVINITLDQLPKALEAEERRIRAAVTKAIETTAERAVTPIKRRVPKAFGELSDSIHAESKPPKTVVSAPHAGSVEKGSMPHTPNWEALLRWVKLRGMQGLTSRGRIRKRFSRSEGPTTPQQARRISTMLKEHEVRGRKGIGRHSPVDAAEQVAKAISKGIQDHGTKPHWFVRSSLPEIGTILHDELKKKIWSRRK